MSNVFAQFFFHCVTLFHSLSFSPALFMSFWLPSVLSPFLLWKGLLGSHLHQPTVGNNAPWQLFKDFSLPSLQREKQKGKDGLRDWIRMLFYWNLQLFLDCRSHWRGTMCSGTEGNSLAPICPKSSGEEFSHCYRGATQQRFCISLRRVRVRVPERSMGSSRTTGAKKTKARE